MTSENSPEQIKTWMQAPRFSGLTRLYTEKHVAAQRGTIATDYPVARDAAERFYARLRELFDKREAITTFGPYSPGQAVAMKRAGIEGIYLGGWATSAKGAVTEDPGPDLASYPLSQVPDEAAPIVRALLTADKNQHFARSRMSEEERKNTPQVDYRPYIIADADTGHGGDGHVRNLVRRFVEVGVPGYHIEDQKPGLKKCGHQGGKVLVPSDEQIKRLNAARFQLDIMGVGGIVVARTDAESATFLDGRSDERDHPFILGATRSELPSYKTGTLALMRQLFELGIEELRGHFLYKISAVEYAAADAWIARAGLESAVQACVADIRSGKASVEQAYDTLSNAYLEAWQAEANLKTFGEAVGDAIEERTTEGEDFGMTREDWMTFARTASIYEARHQANQLGIDVHWDCELPKTPEGYYQIRGGIDYAIAKQLAAAPFADLLWMETKTADLEDAKRFADAIHAVYPDQMLAYNLSPSFNWDTTGMSEDQMREFPVELGKLGFVFNFITYGGHQIDGRAGETFSRALREEGMLALAKLQRKFRLVESPYKTPQSLVGGPRLDAALMASSGRTAATKAMGKGSTQFQHLIQTELPPKVLRQWVESWGAHNKVPGPLRIQLRPRRAGSELLELAILNEAEEKLANVVFGSMQDRRGTSILTIRDQNTVPELRKKRLMTLIQLFLMNRYKSQSVHYVSPTEDNQRQTTRMCELGIFDSANNEVGEIIVAHVNTAAIQSYLDPERDAIKRLITRQ